MSESWDDLVQAEKAKRNRDEALKQMQIKRLEEIRARNRPSFAATLRWNMLYNKSYRDAELRIGWIILLVVGAGWLIAASVMSVSVYESGLGEVLNIGLLNARSNYTLLGCTSLVIAAIYRVGCYLR